MDDAMNMLRERKCSLVVKSTNGMMNAFYGRGIYDLYDILTHNPTMLNGATVADKVIGKGAAAIMIRGRVKAITTLMISEAALKLLRRTSINLDYQVVVRHIINHKGDGICPIERLCMPWGTASRCVEAIKKFLNEQR